MWREQKVGLDADDHNARRFDLCEPRLHRRAVIGDIEQVARAGQVQIAVRIELPGKFIRVMFEIRLDFEVYAKRVIGLTFFCGSFSAKTYPPLLGRTVSDHSEFASKPHADQRHRSRVIVARLPVRIASNHFSLQ